MIQRNLSELHFELQYLVNTLNDRKNKITFLICARTERYDLSA